MKKKISYLTERKFEKEGHIVKNEEKVSYWKKVLGDDNYNFLNANSRKFRGYINEEKYSVNEVDTSEALLDYLVHQETEEIFKECFGIESDVVFSHFYYKILNYSFINLKKQLNRFEKYFDSSVYRDFILHLVMQLQTICTRTLIEQMHMYKDTNKLSGETSQEEYKFFNEIYAGKSEFYNELFEQYPVLYRCIIEKVNQLERFYIEIVRNFEKDKELLQRELFIDKTIKKITQIKSESSDLHNGGKQVVKVEIDNEFEILYKPRSMENEKIYYKILSDLSEKLCVEQYSYRFVTKSDHSWSCIVKYKTCNSDEQIRRYYLRLGIQLFLTYMLGTKDLHYENLIACGEYPVFVDLEVLANPVIDYKRETAKEEIYYQILQSVLGAGILPYQLGSKARINASAISGMEGQICPFKVPVIVDAKTSNMRIEYRYPMSTRAKNLATLKGKFYEPYVYKNDIISGFSKAYLYAIKNKKEIQEMINSLKDMKSRFLATDTQRYSMVLSSSYHPSLLKDGADREVFLNVMWNGRKLCDKDIVNIEIENMLKGDIPYFYSRGRMLYCGEKLISSTYFNKTSVQGIYEKLGMLDEDNLVKQIEYIEVSLDLMSNKKKDYFNKVYHVSENVIRNIEEDTIYDEKMLLKKLLRQAVWNKNKTEVNWPTVQLINSQKEIWGIQAMNHYFYNGLSGMLLLFYELNKTKKNEEIEKIYKVLKRMLFEYTDKGNQNRSTLDSQNTGLYEGEGSVVYVYLILYQISKEQEYLNYAVKHSEILEKLIVEDVHYDLLSGNAGAAWLFILMYQETTNYKYIEAAEKAIDKLVQSAEPQEVGIGWTVEKGVSPMTGMAHGNSGMLMSVIALWKYTGKEIYEKLAMQIWEYEEHLYDKRINNWIDVRQEDLKDEVGAVAWCHGAAGILYSRIICYEMVEDKEWKERLKKDILRAYTKVKNYWKRDSFSLCHGVFGNLWILKKCEMKMVKYQILFMKEEQDFEKYLNNITLLPQETMVPGILNGFGGMILFLLLTFNKV